MTGFLHSDGCRDEQNSTCAVCESGDGDKTGTKSAEVDDDAQKQRKRSSRSSVAMAGDFLCLSVHTGFPFFPFTLFSCRRGKTGLSIDLWGRYGKGYTRYMAR